MDITMHVLISHGQTQQDQIMSQLIYENIVYRWTGRCLRRPSSWGLFQQPTVNQFI